MFLVFIFFGAGLGFLLPALAGILDMGCWFWTASQCTSLVWDINRGGITWLSTTFAFASFGIGASLSARL